MAKKKKKNKKCLKTTTSQNCTGQMYLDANTGQESCCPTGSHVKTSKYGNKICCPDNSDIACMNAAAAEEGSNDQKRWLCKDPSYIIEDKDLGPQCCPGKSKPKHNPNKDAENPYICSPHKTKLASSDTESEQTNTCGPGDSIEIDLEDAGEDILEDIEDAINDCSGHLYPDGNNNGDTTCCPNTEFVKDFDSSDSVCCPNNTDVAGINPDIAYGGTGEDQYLCCDKDSTKQDPNFGTSCCPKGKNIQQGQQGTYMCCNNPPTSTDDNDCKPLNCKNIYKNNMGVNACCDDPNKEIVKDYLKDSFCCKKGNIVGINTLAWDAVSKDPLLICCDPKNGTWEISKYYGTGCCPDGTTLVTSGEGAMQTHTCCPGGPGCTKGKEEKEEEEGGPIINFEPEEPESKPDVLEENNDDEECF